MKKFIKRKLLNFLLRHLFNAITDDDVLRLSRGQVYIGKNILPLKNVQNIVSEAEMFKRTDLWQLLINSGKLAANKRMYERSVNYEDMIFGKATLWVIDIFESKVENIIKDFTKVNK